MLSSTFACGGLEVAAVAAVTAVTLTLVATLGLIVAAGMRP